MEGEVYLVSGMGMMRPALRVALLAAPALLAVGSLARPLPAAAQATNFRQELDDIKESIPGLGATRDPIDFSERAPLVVPPTNNLPPPVESASRLGVTDPDTVNRRKALSDPRRPVPVTDPGAAASGLSSRAYLIEPPSGMRDPRAVEAGIITDKPRPTSEKHRSKHAHKRTPDVTAAQ